METTQALMADSFPPDWLPTAANINALPEPVRKFIHDLETRCDPAGDVQELALGRETIAALGRLLLETEEALARAEQRVPNRDQAEGPARPSLDGPAPSGPTA